MWLTGFLLSFVIEVVVYLHQKPTTLVGSVQIYHSTGDGIVISAAYCTAAQWHVSAISVKYREKYLKQRLMYSRQSPWVVQSNCCH